MTFLKLWGGRKILRKTITSNIMKGTSMKEKLNSIRRPSVHLYRRGFNVTRGIINTFQEEIMGTDS